MTDRKDPPLNNPDGLTPRDSTLLNRLHREYQKDPSKALADQIELKKRIESTIGKLIRTPFRMSQKQRMETVYRWGDKPVYPFSKTMIKKEDDEEVSLLTENVGQQDTSENVDDDVEFIEKKMQALGSQNDKVQSSMDDHDGMIRDFVAVHKKYLVINFSYYVEYLGYHIPAEFAVAEFSVQNGLGKTISGLIDMGDIPLGYASDVRERMGEIYVPHPGYNKEFKAGDALSRIGQFCHKYFPPGKTILLFTLKEHIPIVHHGLQWLLEHSEEEFTCSFHILPFSVLIQTLANESQTPQYKEISDPKNEQPKCFVPHECYLDSFLHRVEYADMPELACQHHAKEENMRGIPYCSENVVKRCIYNASRILVELFKIPPLMNCHYPLHLIESTPPVLFGPNYSTCEDTSDAASSFSQSTATERASGTTTLPPKSKSTATTGRYANKSAAGPGWKEGEILAYFKIEPGMYGKGPCDIHDMRPSEEQQKEFETLESEEESFDDTASVKSFSSSSSSILSFKKFY